MTSCIAVVNDGAATEFRTHCGALAWCGSSWRVKNGLIQNMLSDDVLVGSLGTVWGLMEPCRICDRRCLDKKSVAAAHRSLATVPNPHSVQRWSPLATVIFVNFDIIFDTIYLGVPKS